MATISTPSSVVNRKEARCRFYTWVAVGAALVVFLGFARTYYLKGLYGTPPPFRPVLSPLLHVHGLVMTTWFVLSFVQVRLVAAQRTDLHRRLGVAGAMLAGLVVGIDGDVTLRNVHRSFMAHPESPHALGFLAINFGILLSFAILIASAILLRRRPDYHKRFMALACLSILGPAIDRLSLTLPFLQFLDSLSQWKMFGVWDLGAAVCIGVDALKNRKLHPAWLWGAILILGTQLVTGVLTYVPAWQRFAAWLVR